MGEKRLKSQSKSESRSLHLLTKIKEFTRALLVDLTNGRSPPILIPRFTNYCTHPISNSNCSCGSDLPSGNETLTLSRESHLHRLDVMLRVLLIVQKLLQENKHSSRRDIYYMHPSVFLDQSVVDRAINDICVLMHCSRHNLNVVSAGNGYNMRTHSIFGTNPLLLVMGWIRFFEGKRMFDCISSPNTAHPVPVHVEEVKDIVSVARYILVVEKESVFQRLANDQFCNANHCIVITGRGYPDIPTRRFLRLLVENLHLPAYCLVDCDPYGFDILTTYRFGSMQMAYDTKHLRVPEIHWLGAFPSDSERYFVPKQCLLPLTTEDKRKVEAMLLRCYLQKVPQWRLELKLMLQKGVKFEIEALSVHTLSFLSESYIPSKIQADIVLKRVNFTVMREKFQAERCNKFIDIINAMQACVLKVKTQCEPCKIKVMQVLRNIRGVYNITIDGEQGTVKVSGTVNPTTFLGVLEKYGKHAEVKFIRFDGEVVERRYGEYGYGYDPYGMEGSYPQLGCHQHQWYPTSLPPPPPPPPRPPPLAQYRLAHLPPPPPVAPHWGPPPRPYGPPPLPSHCPRGNKIVLPEENHCAVM